MNTQYLKKRRQTWYVRLRVPTTLEHIIGKQHLEESLKTRDLAEANRLKYTVVAKFKNYIEAVRKASENGTPLTELMSATRWMAEEIRLGKTSHETISIVWSEMLDKYLDKNHDRDKETGEYLTDETTTEQLRIASSLVSNPELYLLSKALEDYLTDVAKRVRRQTYKAKEKRINDFLSWLKVDKEPHRVTKKEAGRFLTEELSARGLSPKSIKDFLSDLSAFFNWMEGRGYVEFNPFKGLSGTVRSTSRGVKNPSKRREWTEHELLTLLSYLQSKKNTKLVAMTLIALYSGMRSNEIAELELTDVNTDYFHIPEGKTESSIRDVPIHPAIKPLVEHLKASSSDGYLIGGLKRGGQDQKRNHYMVKRFGSAKRAAGIDDSAVVFHSLRKNFSGELERAGIPENLAQQIVGHKKQSLTYGLYSQGVKLEHMIDAMSKVSHGTKVDTLASSLVNGL